VGVYVKVRTFYGSDDRLLILIINLPKAKINKKKDVHSND
jgi:hypothetical protein